MKSAIRIQADAIIVSSQQLFAPGQIVISRGRIVEVAPRIDATADVQLENCVLLPGLINPHTHLEFSDLAEPLSAGQNFPEWIANVLRVRQNAAETPSAKAATIASGLMESQAAGVVALGDIVTPPWQPACLLPSPTAEAIENSLELDPKQWALLKPHLASASHLPQVVAFIEQLGLSAERRRALAGWRDQLLDIPPGTWPDRLSEMAFSPHAPYSTPPILWQEIMQLAKANKASLAMHVLESPAEREWLDSGTGPMADMLAQFGAAGWRLPADFITQLCQQFSDAKSALLIHGNYLSESELDCVAGAKNVTIVYCPRTHEHFGHTPFPLSSIQQRGIRLLLGTDSRSTNPDLNLWQEGHTALRNHPTLTPTQAFSAITDAAAEALDLQDDFGSLQPGRLAAIACLRMPQPPPTNLNELLAQLFEQASHPTLIQ